MNTYALNNVNSQQNNRIRLQQNDGAIIEGQLISGIFGTKSYNNQVTYRGEFLNGLKHGIGQEFYNNGVVYYEGSFSQERAHGKGRFYYANGILNYEGDVSNGYWHGEGKCYNQNGNLVYEGSFSQGKAHGQGRLYYPNGNLNYEGGFSYSIFNGYGKLYDNLGNYYEGNFVNGFINGYGIKIDTRQFRYEAFFTNGIMNGKVCIYANNMDRLEGYFINDKLEGIGTIFSCNNEKISVAEYKNGLLDGFGIELIDGKRYEFFATNGNISSNKKLITGQSIYWDIIFNEYNNDKSKLLDKFQTYSLVLDLLNSKARFEIDISSPWISEWIFKGEFIKAMRNAINRKVCIKIVTGFGDNRNSKTIKCIYKLKDELGHNISIIERNTHEKILLCDDKLMLEGSHNLLSYEVKDDGRYESMGYDTDKDRILSIRNSHFNF